MKKIVLENGREECERLPSPRYLIASGSENTRDQVRPYRKDKRGAAQVSGSNVTPEKETIHR